MKIRPWPYFCEIYLMRTGEFIRKRTSTMKASCVLTSFLFQPMPFEKVCSFVFVHKLYEELAILAFTL